MWRRISYYKLLAYYKLRVFYHEVIRVLSRERKIREVILVVQKRVRNKNDRMNEFQKADVTCKSVRRNTKR